MKLLVFARRSGETGESGGGLGWFGGSGEQEWRDRGKLWREETSLFGVFGDNRTEGASFIIRFVGARLRFPIY